MEIEVQNDAEGSSSANSSLWFFGVVKLLVLPYWWRSCCTRYVTSKSCFKFMDSYKYFHASLHVQICTSVVYKEERAIPWLVLSCTISCSKMRIHAVTWVRFGFILYSSFPAHNLSSHTEISKAIKPAYVEMKEVSIPMASQRIWHALIIWEKWKARGGKRWGEVRAEIPLDMLQKVKCCLMLPSMSPPGHSF